MTSNHPPESPRRIAIVGGGISGIACSWKLRELDCTVDIYDADDRLGGHANSVPFEGNGRSVNVDTGFIAMDEKTYPQFNAFLRYLGIETIPTDMSFGVATIDGAFEWGSYSFWSFVGKLSRLCSPWFWRLGFDIVRFSYFAQDILSEIPHASAGEKATNFLCSREDTLEKDLEEEQFESIGSYLRRQSYSDQFLRLFLIPMVAAPWCVDPDEFSMNFPAIYLVHFMLQHGLLDCVARTLRWRSFRDGSKTYVDAFQNSLPIRHRLHLSTPVRQVLRRSGGGASLELANGACLKYDHIVLAVHANQALSILGDEPTGLERSILGCFKTSKNVCYLHSDVSLLPKRASARVAWNCLLASSQGFDHSAPKYGRYEQAYTDPEELQNSRISITFDMNKLQAIPNPGEDGSPGRVLVTLNPVRAPRSPQSSQVYYHPLISSESILALRHLYKINGTASISFAGAWMGYGFHEDGFAAGTHVAKMLINGCEKTAPMELGTLPEKPDNCISLRDTVARSVLSMIQHFL